MLYFFALQSLKTKLKTIEILLAKVDPQRTIQLQLMICFVNMVVITIDTARFSVFAESATLHALNFGVCVSWSISQAQFLHRIW